MSVVQNETVLRFLNKREYSRNEYLLRITHEERT